MSIVLVQQGYLYVGAALFLASRGFYLFLSVRLTGDYIYSGAFIVWLFITWMTMNLKLKEQIFVPLELGMQYSSQQSLNQPYAICACAATAFATISTLNQFSTNFSHGHRKITVSRSSRNRSVRCIVTTSMKSQISTRRR